MWRFGDLAIWWRTVRRLSFLQGMCALRSSPNHQITKSPNRQILLIVLCLFVAACGYTSKPLYPENVRTVAVPIFENRTFYQGVEFDVTEAVIKELELRADAYKVTPAERADTVLTGTITGVDQSRLSRRHDGGMPQEMEMRIRVNFAWKDARTGQVLCERRGFEAAATYIPAREVGEPYMVGQHGAAQNLATAIVSAMRSEW